MTKANAVVIAAQDNVATVLVDLAPGDEIVVDGSAISVSACESIPVGHKIAIAQISAGDAILKYGQVIGRASADIGAGSHVHTHNLTGQEI